MMDLRRNPYLAVDTVERFRLPNGHLASMEDIVTVEDRARYVEEVKMMQAALGVKPDGIFGPETRAAIRRVVTRKE